MIRLVHLVPELRKPRRIGAPIAFAALVCAACGTSESSGTGARHDGGPDASASGGANTSGTGGAGNHSGTGGAGNNAGSGGAGDGPASGGAAGLATGGARVVDGAPSGGNGGARPIDGGDGGGACASAVDQLPCSTPGTSCGGPCTDPCVFCNLLVCSGGVWQHVEAAPAPCFDCGAGRCQIGATFCSIIHASTDAFECLRVPAGCERDVTCSCIGPKVSAESCTSTGQGQVTVERSGG